MNRIRWMLALLALAGATAHAQTIEVPYRGLEYSMLSKEGVTVMIAPLDLSILKYSAAHVWITNGSTLTVQVSPQGFSARARSPRQPQPANYVGVSEVLVVNEALKRARFGDILALVRAYERNLYGFKNPQAVNYYQQRKQIAAAEGGSRRMRAAATVSALVLPKTEVPPGEFREGTVFFPTGDGKPEFLEFSLRLGELSFLFRPGVREFAPRQEPAPAGKNGGKPLH